MTLPTKIVVIGAGSASFGENTLSALMRSQKLRGSTLALVDRNVDMLEVVRRLAERASGRVELASTEGAGSTFSLYLPLSV